MPTSNRRTIDIGQRVEVINLTYPGGGVAIGDIGIVVDAISDVQYHIDIPGKHNYWLCMLSDVRVCEDRKRETTDDEELHDKAMSGVNNYITINRRMNNNMRTEINNINSQIRQKFSELMNLNKHIRDISKLQECDVRRIRRINDDDKAYNYLRILFRDKYERITYGTFEIQALTKPITMREKVHPDDDDYEVFNMGRYWVSINILDGNIKIWNEHEDNGRNGYPHPHVLNPDNEHNICWGTWDRVILDAMRTYDYLYVLDKAHQFLSTCDMNSPYRHVGYWSKTIDDRCLRCWNDVDDCDCPSDDDNTCGNCGNHVDDCSCDRCPNSGELVEGGIPDDYCQGGECRHWISDGDSDNYYCSA